MTIGTCAYLHAAARQGALQAGAHGAVVFYQKNMHVVHVSTAALYLSCITPSGLH